MPQLSYLEPRAMVSEDGVYWEYDASGEPTGNYLVLFEGASLPVVRSGFAWALWGEWESPQFACS
jgi:hypothetical protein